jgi:hypothetical protein
METETFHHRQMWNRSRRLTSPEQTKKLVGSDIFYHSESLLNVSSRMFNFAFGVVVVVVVVVVVDTDFIKGVY